ncbi:putative exosome complex component rrp40 [Pocillopora damicornis]|uniref:putative exosome complex component rrp40 n=1 Tax=Pocillopora damicornis TaxID=46731 RepID=UPI000F5524F7|nr:putative exosome complex component rrp40 [Pocillopora damicornis]
MADKYVGSLLNRIALPGDVISSVADLEGSLEGKNKVKLGPGLREVNGAIVAYKAGVFRHRNPSIHLIDCNQRRASIFNSASPCPATFSHRLLSKEFVLLKCLGKHFLFDCTVGMNGRVWINSSSIPHTITVANAVSNSEYMNNNQIETMV